VSPSMFIAAWILGNRVAVGWYDLVAYFFLAENETVSHWIQTWFRDLPILAVLAGIVIGHLAWPIHYAGKRGGEPSL